MAKQLVSCKCFAEYLMKKDGVRNNFKMHRTILYRLFRHMTSSACLRDCILIKSHWIKDFLISQTWTTFLGKCFLEISMKLKQSKYLKTFSILVTHCSKYLTNFVDFYNTEKVLQKVDIPHKKGKRRENIGGGSKGCSKCF